MRHISIPWAVAVGVSLTMLTARVPAEQEPPAQATIDACRGCDVLVHEALTPAFLTRRPETFRSFASKYHTTTTQLADLAREARPRLLILYHHSSQSMDELQSEMLARYPGHFVIGRDLDVY